MLLAVTHPLTPTGHLSPPSHRPLIPTVPPPTYPHRPRVSCVKRFHAIAGVAHEHARAEERLRDPELQAAPLRDVPLAAFRLSHERTRERLAALAEVFREGSAWWYEAGGKEGEGRGFGEGKGSGGGSGGRREKSDTNTDTTNGSKTPRALASHPQLQHAAREMSNHLERTEARVEEFSAKLRGLLALASMTRDELDCLQAIMHGPAMDPTAAAAAAAAAAGRRKQAVSQECKRNIDSLLVGTASELDGFDEDEGEKTVEGGEGTSLEQQGDGSVAPKRWRMLTLSQATALLADKRNQNLVVGQEKGMQSLVELSREWMRVE